MRAHRLLGRLLLASIGAACADSPTAENRAGVFLAVLGEAQAGASLDVRLVNHSTATVRVGWLPCYVETDHLEGRRWTESPRERGGCILPEYTIEPGKFFPFPLSAPATAGTYRLRTLVAGDSVFSAAFTVR